MSKAIQKKESGLEKAQVNAICEKLGLPPGYWPSVVAYYKSGFTVDAKDFESAFSLYAKQVNESRLAPDTYNLRLSALKSFFLKMAQKKASEKLLAHKNLIFLIL